MRTLPAGMAAKVTAADFTGANKATTRVTIQKIQLGTFQNGAQLYSSPIFLQVPSSAVELPNVSSLNIDRSVDSEIATMQMELFNTKPLPPGTMPDTGDTFDLLGFYTYNRGRTSYSQGTWGHSANEWQDLLVPDRLVRTYQGYGANYAALPENDTNLVLTGTWLIDDVTYSADGLISVDARDVGRLLVDQIAFPPVVPLSQYPLTWEQYRTVTLPKVPSPSTAWVRPVLEGSSNGLAGASTVVQFGHHPADAFDTSTDPQTGTYWLSRGHAAPRAPDSFEWIQGKLSGSQDLSAVKFAVRGGPYRVLLSIWTDTRAGGKITGWNGVARVPYAAGTTIENFSKIPYIATIVAEHGSEKTITFPAIKGAVKVRLTFTELYNSRHMPLPYRAAVRDVQVALGTVTMVDGGTRVEGNYGDYAEIVKRLLAYGGFYWPQNGVQYLTGANSRTYSFASGTGDPYLAKAGRGEQGDAARGRVWGDIKMSGTSGPAALGVEVWDKKPLMDCINYVKDILGYLFYVDEHAGAVFRPPNIYKLGNYRSDVDGLNTSRTLDFITIEDSQAILGLRAKLSSRNLRERVFVANVNGKIGAIAKGRIPHPSNLRRVGGWTDQNFLTSGECQVMADLISLRQLFTFRTNSIRIPANPALQPDDQIKVLERTTGDAYFHYVRGISSSWNLADGKWIYDLTTSWLGENPAGEWAFKTSGLAAETQAYLAALGQL